MHASLMRKTGARPEITRDNMRHSETDITLDVYTKTWWDERVDAVSRVVEAVFDDRDDKKEEAEQDKSEKSARKPVNQDGSTRWVPFWVLQKSGQLGSD